MLPLLAESNLVELSLKVKVFKYKGFNIITCSMPKGAGQGPLPEYPSLPPTSKFRQLQKKNWKVTEMMETQNSKYLENRFWLSHFSRSVKLLKQKIYNTFLWHSVQNWAKIGY